MARAVGLRDEERILVDGCRAGDERAWLAVYEAYAADIGRFLVGMLGSNEDIEDLVQQVFLQFLSSLARFRGEAGLRTWLHRIARNVALHHIRGQQRRRRRVQAYANAVTSDADDPAGRMAARARLNRIQALLGELDDTFREVWVLRELQGFSVAKAATVLDVPAATVRTRHHRARAKLLELLAAEDRREAQRVSQPARLELVSSNEDPS